MMTELYYTVTRNEIRSNMPKIPVLVSAAGYTVPVFGKKATYRLRTPALPGHVTERAADCGGFAATTRWGGQYRFRPRQYVAWLMKWRPEWAATMDLCCFDLNEQGVPIYPCNAEVERRQRFTTLMARDFWADYQHLPLTWVVTLQGWHPEEYVRHAQVLAPLIREMAETYYDTGSTEEDDDPYVYRVGLGSLCGRDPQLVHEIIDAVRTVIGIVPLHLWGTKLAFLRSPAELDGVASLDSAAWNGLWGEEHEARRQSGLSEAHYCWKVSYPAYALRVEKALQQPRFSPLLPLSSVAESTVQAARAAQVPLPECLCYRRTGEGPGEQRGLPLLP